MSRQRLEARTQQVVRHGAAYLHGFAHSFTHRGGDGSGKGNIIADDSSRVCGVLYSLTPDQVKMLHSYETGYEIVHVEVCLFCAEGDGAKYSSYTYRSETQIPGLLPIEEYLAHYTQGMRENDFPDMYVQFISAQASGTATT